jgi:ABC-type nitrate/sulfonate/bicarbonate transport system substrate-binding protein
MMALFMAVLASAAPSAAQERGLKKIYWGLSTLSPTLWIPYLAKDAMIFEKNGLGVELVLLRGSGQTSQAMVAGSLFASSVALPAVMLADLTYPADAGRNAEAFALCSTREKRSSIPRHRW